MIPALKAARTLVIIGAALLSGCGPPPPPHQAMVALEAGGGHGYSESKLSPDHYKVTYSSPSIPVPLDADRRRAMLDGERQRVRDLATWRAAQIAQRDGFAWLEIEREDIDVEVSASRTFYRTYYRDSYDPVYPWRPYRQRRWPYDPLPFGSPSRSSSRASAKLTANLDVFLFHVAGEGRLDAAMSAARLAKQYGAATYPR